MYNNLKKFGAFVTITVLVLSMITVYAISESLDVEEQNTIECMIQDSPPYPSTDISGNIVTKVPSTSKILNNVPTSTWTYGCSPTSAGMIFGFYDRTTHANMYTGPANGGVCPLTNLGQGIGSPISGSCYIIATQQGHDGITEKAHVDDYWISTGSSGPDPWEGSWPEHGWELCTADFMGTSQWKWDVDGDGVKDLCSDGSTIFYYWSDGSKGYDPIPPASYGLPQTAGCHGMKLFAQSRGYSVVTNFNQRTDNYHPNGFTFPEFKAEIDANRPVLIHVEGHSMVGLGYDDSTTPETIYIHNTWDNSLHQMPWGGSYDGRVLKGVTVIRLHGGNSVPSVHITYPSDSATVSGEITIQGTASDPDGSISEVQVRIDTGSWQTASGTTSWSFDWDTTAVNNGFHTISARSKDNDGAYSTVDTITVNVDNVVNQRPTVQITSPSSSETVIGTITIEGTAADSDGTVTGVEVRIDGGSWETATGTTSWSYSWDTTTVSDGSHTIHARSKDDDGAYSTSDSVTVNVNNGGNDPPTVDITQPRGGSTVSGTITIQGTASDSDGSVTQVQVRIDGGSWQTCSGTTSWSKSWDTTTVGDGSHRIYAHCKDDDGAYSTSDYVIVNVNNGGNNPPTVQITSPSSGITVSGTITITGTAADSDGTVTQVQVKIDSGSWQTCSGTTSWSKSWDTTTVSDGSHTIHARSQDDDGAYSTTPDSVTVTVSNGGTNRPPDKPTLTGPTNGNVGESYTYSVSTTDPDGDDVFYEIDWDDGSSSGWKGSYNSGEIYNISHIWQTQGSYTIKVKAKDTNDAESDWSDPLSVTMPRNKVVNRPFLQFLEQYPILYQLLLRFLQL